MIKLCNLLLYWKNAWNDVRCFDKCRKARYLKYCMCPLPILKKNQSSDWPKWCYMSWRKVISCLFLYKTSFKMVQQAGRRYINHAHTPRCRHHLEQWASGGYDRHEGSYTGVPLPQAGKDGWRHSSPLLPHIGCPL